MDQKIRAFFNKEKDFGPIFSGFDTSYIFFDILTYGVTKTLLKGYDDATIWDRWVAGDPKPPSTLLSF